MRRPRAPVDPGASATSPRPAGAAPRPLATAPRAVAVAAQPAATALRVAVAVLLALTVAGCGWRASTGDAGRAPAGIELTVFAAASLREAFGAVKEAYEAATPAVTLVFSFDASSALRAQVEQGAPVDVFASAD
ncbi:MAG: substrate-binding domain-containing protein, partial [Chloroflexota bacterium]